MDAFFVSVEIRDNPKLKEKAVAVGGKPEMRGVISTCNYKARKFGVHSAMPSKRAMALCRDLIILPGSMTKYKAVSNQIREIFLEFTESVEPLSLDEAYLDVTNTKRNKGSASLMADAIRRQIFERTRLTASAGVGPNKLIAKIASDVNKPNGSCIVPPDKVLSFISPLPVHRLFGVGKATFAKLHEMNIKTCQELQSCELSFLSEKFGKLGHSLYHFCRGIDSRNVTPNRIRKSISVEKTFLRDISDPSSFAMHAEHLISTLKERMASFLIEDKYKAKSVFVKMKFKDFKQTTVEKQTTEITLVTIESLFHRAYERVNKPVRLIGIGVKLRDVEKIKQKPETLTLFDYDAMGKKNS